MVAVTENPILLQPDDENILIRRYMSFSKYLDLLSRRALFFPSIAALDDPFEGTFSEGTLREIRAMILAQEVNAGEADKLIDRWRGILRDIRNRIYVSCWHASQAESAAMWRLYGFIGESICIVTTYKILRDALPPVCQIGKIRYMDFKVDHFEINRMNSLIPAMHKRLEYSHESEVRAAMLLMGQERAVYSDGRRIEPQENGFLVPVDVCKLVSRVIISPDASDWFINLVKNLTGKYCEGLQVEKSTLADDPIP